MLWGRIIPLVAFAALAIPCVVSAQHASPAAGHAAAPAPAAHAAPPRVPSSRASASHHASSTAPGVVAHSSNGSPYPFDTYGVSASPRGSHFDGPVSSRGFDNPLAGKNGGHARPKTATGIIILGGYPYYGYGYAADDSQVQAPDQAQDEADDQQSVGRQEPQYIFVQQVPDPRGQGQQAANDQAELAPAPERDPPVPLRDVGSFTLVTRAGDRLDAVAFTSSNGRLIYITPDGGRRSISFDDLDIDSTQRLNQELGTPVDLPQPEDPHPSPATPNPKTYGETTN
jgi:hypothetical protein